MSDHIENGGTAFPTACSNGMWLRDYFAARAMHAHLITDTVPGPACDALLQAAIEAGREPLEHLAFNSYQCADAMLRARKMEPQS